MEPLLALGYAYIPEYETWLLAELFFRKGIPDPSTHPAACAVRSLAPLFAVREAVGRVGWGVTSIYASVRRARPCRRRGNPCCNGVASASAAGPTKSSLRPV
jgi:hypothetical protein